MQKGRGQLQFNVVSEQTLAKAQAEPEKYRNLATGCLGQSEVLPSSKENKTTSRSQKHASSLDSIGEAEMTSAICVRVGFLVALSVPDVAWSMDNLRTLVEMGFNTSNSKHFLGARPADERSPEDVVVVIGLLLSTAITPVALDTDPKRVCAAQGRSTRADRLFVRRGCGRCSLWGARNNMHARLATRLPTACSTLQSARCTPRAEGLCEQFPASMISWCIPTTKRVVVQ